MEKTASFEFRFPQDEPEFNDELQQDEYSYFLDGNVKFTSSNEMILQIEDFEEYKMIGRRGKFAFEGKCDEAEAKWTQISEDEYVGVWFEDEVEVLFRITLDN